jgi:hypothetical protein
MIESKIAISQNMPKFDQQIDKLLYIAKLVVGADAAAVLMSTAGIKHCIAESGLATGIVAVPWSWGDLPFKANQTFVQLNPTNLNISRLLTAITGQSSVGLFIRLPLFVSEQYDLALQLYSREQTKRPGQAEMRLLKQTAALIAIEMRETAELLASRDSHISITKKYTNVLQEVNLGENLRTILNSNLSVVAMSKTLANRLQITPEEAFGRKYFQIVASSAEPISFLFRKALDTGTSSPIFQIISDLGEMRRSYTLRASPFRPLDYDEDLLDVQIWETTSGANKPKYFNTDGSGFSEDFDDEMDTAGQFLLDTLISKRSIRLRDQTTYMTLRTWRNSIKQHQIKALRALKKNISQDVVVAIGKECASEINRLVGISSFRFIVPIPCGHSPEQTCLSNAIANSVGRELGLPVIHAFPHLKQTGSSHPKENLKREKMRQVQEIPGPAILIDDVATSGMHLGEAATLLKSAGTSTFSLAWIGGEVAD